MDADQLLQALQQAVTQREAADKAEYDALLAALRGKVPLADVIEATGYSREKLRRIARDAGVPLRREATVVSKRQAETEQP